MAKCCDVIATPLNAAGRRELGEVAHLPQAGQPPVILLGMHRSGTAAVARVLEELGLFQGAHLQNDHESTWFLHLNEVMLRRVNASWDHPMPLREFLANPEALALTLECLQRDVASVQTRQYLGLWRLLRYGSLQRFDRPWGWKDPRTVFTLPVWLKLFPGAKLVYIVRNGVDVAASLMTRELKELQRRQRKLGRPARKWSSHSSLQQCGFKGSSRCLALEGAFSLWEQYLAEAERILGQVSNDRHIVHFEQFVSDPAPHLPALARFCGLEPADEALSKVARLLNPKRANAFGGDAALAAFYQRVRHTQWMTHYGYDQLEV